VRQTRTCRAFGEGTACGVDIRWPPRVVKAYLISRSSSDNRSGMLDPAVRNSAKIDTSM